MICFCGALAARGMFDTPRRCACRAPVDALLLTSKDMAKAHICKDAALHIGVDENARPRSCNTCPAAGACSSAKA